MLAKIHKSAATVLLLIKYKGNENHKTSTIQSHSVASIKTLSIKMARREKNMNGSRFSYENCSAAYCMFESSDASAATSSYIYIYVMYKEKQKGNSLPGESINATCWQEQSVKIYIKRDNKVGLLWVKRINECTFESSRVQRRRHRGTVWGKFKWSDESSFIMFSTAGGVHVRRTAGEQPEGCRLWIWWLSYAQKHSRSSRGIWAFTGRGGGGVGGDALLQRKVLGWTCTTKQKHSATAKTNIITPALSRSSCAS